jgi:osmotically-inducible protein OsmY
MGPDEARPSDERILEDVVLLVSRHGWLDLHDVRIRVENGEVILDGSVRSEDDRRQIALVAEGVTGVTDVRNRLRARHA